MNQEDFSVLLSIYDKENEENFREALLSIYHQTVVPKQLVVVKDGPIRSELENVLGEFETSFETLTVVPLEKNLGLGLALAKGLSYCQYDLVARADSDDINHPNRFERQLKAFKENSDLILLGGQIQEFYKSDEGEIVVTGSRQVPLKDSEIRQFSKKRNPFNHMTVMFNKTAIQSAGGYRDRKGHEDYDLWMRVLKLEKPVMNLSETLVNARAGHEMMKRRGGLEYAKQFYKIRKEFFQEGYIDLKDFVMSILAAIGLAIFPNSLRHTIYQKLLRK